MLRARPKPVWEIRSQQNQENQETARRTPSTEEKCFIENICDLELKNWNKFIFWKILDVYISDFMMITDLKWWWQNHYVGNISFFCAIFAILLIFFKISNSSPNISSTTSVTNIVITEKSSDWQIASSLKHQNCISIQSPIKTFENQISIHFHFWISQFSYRISRKWIVFTRDEHQKKISNPYPFNSFV